MDNGIPIASSKFKSLSVVHVLISWYEFRGTNFVVRILFQTMYSLKRNSYHEIIISIIFFPHFLGKRTGFKLLFVLSSEKCEKYCLSAMAQCSIKNAQKNDSFAKKKRYSFIRLYLVGVFLLRIFN